MVGLRCRLQANTDYVQNNCREQLSQNLLRLSRKQDLCRRFYDLFILFIVDSYG